MRKILVFLLLTGFTLACVATPDKDPSFEDKAATHVAIALTATALDTLVSADTPQPNAAATAEPSPTPTDEPPDDPKSALGDPDYTDTCSSWSAWSVEAKDQVLESVTTISVSDGKLSMQSSQPGKFHWWLNYRELGDGYLEAVYETGNCSGADQYGLVFRAPDYFNGVGYYFTLTCDGQYDLREKDDPNSLIQDNQLRFNMKKSEHIKAGANQSNTLGVWMDGSMVRLFINGHFIDEIKDAKITTAGHFGPFIYGRNTAGFKISLDEISYWLLD